jgi:hypothetical protein
MQLKVTEKQNLLLQYHTPIPYSGSSQAKLLPQGPHSKDSFVANAGETLEAIRASLQEWRRAASLHVSRLKSNVKQHRCKRSRLHRVVLVGLEKLISAMTL